MNDNGLEEFIRRALEEDTGSGDHSSLASISAEAAGRLKLIVKDTGIIAGITAAREVFHQTDPSLRVKILINDGSRVEYGMTAFTAEGNERSLLRAERLVLNIMQRMSGIATATAIYVSKVADTKAKITDTRKTTPGMRFLEKEAVRLGGGVNHRMGLYDMIMLKDNHIDFAGGITQAVARTRKYLKSNDLSLKIEVEARSLKEVAEILASGGVDRIMLDNFSVPLTAEAVKLINGVTEVESSGDITLTNVRDYALCGVDFISIGALTHHISSLDLSLKAF
ncbi:MAG TPA: carboxylating nicotinate-nucleotide diphosphorylase [Bacteroidales bacterium]|nr:carboxylating nicotinate-nucleotide diphosphorylase [Bacteroidales bacterium]